MDSEDVGVWFSNGKLVGGRDCVGPYRIDDLIDVEGVARIGVLDE